MSNSTPVTVVKPDVTIPSIVVEGLKRPIEVVVKKRRFCPLIVENTNKKLMVRINNIFFISTILKTLKIRVNKKLFLKYHVQKFDLNIHKSLKINGILRGSIDYLEAVLKLVQRNTFSIT